MTTQPRLVKFVIDTSLLINKLKQPTAYAEDRLSYRDILISLAKDVIKLYLKLFKQILDEHTALEEEIQRTLHPAVTTRSIEDCVIEAQKLDQERKVMYNELVRIKDEASELQRWLFLLLTQQVRPSTS